MLTHGLHDVTLFVKTAATRADDAAATRTAAAGINHHPIIQTSADHQQGNGIPRKKTFHVFPLLLIVKRQVQQPIHNKTDDDHPKKTIANQTH